MTRACAPKLHLPVQVLGHAIRITGFMAYFVIWKAVLCPSVPRRYLAQAAL